MTRKIQETIKSINYKIIFFHLYSGKCNTHRYHSQQTLSVSNYTLVHNTTRFNRVFGANVRSMEIISHERCTHTLGLFNHSTLSSLSFISSTINHFTRRNSNFHTINKIYPSPLSLSQIVRWEIHDRTSGTVDNSLRVSLRAIVSGSLPARGLIKIHRKCKLTVTLTARCSCCARETQGFHTDTR